MALEAVHGEHSRLLEQDADPVPGKGNMFMNQWNRLGHAACQRLTRVWCEGDELQAFLHHHCPMRLCEMEIYGNGFLEALSYRQSYGSYRRGHVYGSYRRGLREILKMWHASHDAVDSGRFPDYGGKGSCIYLIASFSGSDMGKGRASYTTWRPFAWGKVTCHDQDQHLRDLPWWTLRWAADFNRWRPFEGRSCMCHDQDQHLACKTKKPMVSAAASKSKAAKPAVNAAAKKKSM